MRKAVFYPKNVGYKERKNGLTRKEAGNW